MRVYSEYVGDFGAAKAACEVHHVRTGHGL